MKPLLTYLVIAALLLTAVCRCADGVRGRAQQLRVARVRRLEEGESQ
jgi:hypothetical protein